MMLLGFAGRSASSAIARHAAPTLWRKQAGYDASIDANTSASI